jgi:predicted GIY-YIG superfamily endonuclease
VYAFTDSAHRWCYQGKTDNLRRRMRQHRGEIAGGAARTRRFGGDILLLFVVTGFCCARDALHFEWALQDEIAPRARIRRTAAFKADRRARRARIARVAARNRPTACVANCIVSLGAVLQLERWTGQALPAAHEWRGTPAPGLLVWWFGAHRPVDYGFVFDALPTPVPVLHAFGVSEESFAALSGAAAEVPSTAGADDGASVAIAGAT